MKCNLLRVRRSINTLNNQNLWGGAGLSEPKLVSILCDAPFEKGKYLNSRLIAKFGEEISTNEVYNNRWPGDTKEPLSKTNELNLVRACM